MKYFLTFLILFLFFVVTPTKAQDVSHFELTGNFIYDLTDTDTVKIREEVQLRNLTTEKYAPSFTFDVSGFHPENVAVFENGLLSKVNQVSDTQYEITLKKPALGSGAKKVVAITFTDSTLVTRQGEVLEIHIPRVQDDRQFSVLTTTVRVPKDKAALFHIFPPVQGVEKSQYIEYSFSTEQVKSKAITAFVGDVAAYDFTLKYPFTNSSYFTREVTFAIPPDTALQKVHIHSFSEEPETLTYDSDGNWIGKLSLKPRESKQFEIKGTVFVYASVQPDFPTPSEEAVSLNLQPNKYWESNSSEIQSLAQNLKTPGEIYEYVTNTLSYDYTKTTRPQERLGAKESLSRKSEAICMEFTDLFIAIARAARIPAREINGFALSTDTTRPRSLGQNILHSWSEYWDTDSKRWIPVDPTWGNTTGGVDYFSHFDLNHISFVVHGASSTLPQTPGTYETVDSSAELIHIEPSTEATEEKPLSPLIEQSLTTIGLWQMPYEITIKNTSGRALYDVAVSLEGDGVTYNQKRVVSILPFSKYSFTTNLNTGFFGSKLPSNLQIKLSDSEKQVSVSKAPIIVLHFFVLLLPFILVPVVILFYIKKYAKHSIS